MSKRTQVSNLPSSELIQSVAADNQGNGQKGEYDLWPFGGRMFWENGFIVRKELPSVRGQEIKIHFFPLALQRLSQREYESDCNAVAQTKRFV